MEGKTGEDSRILPKLEYKGVGKKIKIEDSKEQDMEEEENRRKG